MNPAGTNLADQLTRAEETASREPEHPPDQPVLPCPKLKRLAIEVVVVDEMNHPLADIMVQLEQSPQQVLIESTGPKGKTRFEKLVPSSYQLTLPLVDEKAWELIETVPLEHPESSGDASWTAPTETEEGDNYRVVLGDCMASIAFQKGFLPETLWDYGGNSKLQDGIRTVHVLNPEDIVELPKLSRHHETVSTGNRYKLRRKGVPERLRIRFLNYRMQPRSGLPYMLRVESASGLPIPDKSGRLDGAGLLDVPIPPDASRGEILLRDEYGDQESFDVDLGYVNPFNEISGAQARLNNLHYLAGEESGEMNDSTAEALRQFQFDHKLPVTGQVDGATRALLHSLHVS